MEDEKTLKRARNETTPLESASSDARPAEEILPHVRALGGVAREARRSCEKGAEAMKKLHLRRNRSGE